MEGARGDTGTFLLERAEAEHAAAERKREAAVTKASAIATLAAALIAIVAAPAFDVAGLADGATRWVMLGAIVLLLLAIGCAAGALLVRPRPGDRPAQHELENWTTSEFRRADPVEHAGDFTRMFVRATGHLRVANERAEAWLTWAVIAVAVGLVLLAGAFVVEVG